MKREKKILTYKDFIEKLGNVVEESKLLLRIKDDYVFIDGKSFHEYTINRIQRLLQLYGECEWWIRPSDTLEEGIMYSVKIFSYK